MALEESPDDDDGQRAQENNHRLDLWADETVYSWHQDHLNSRTSTRTLSINFRLLRFVTTAGKTSRTRACWRAPRIPRSTSSTRRWRGKTAPRDAWTVGARRRSVLSSVEVNVRRSSPASTTR